MHVHIHRYINCYYRNPFLPFNLNFRALHNHVAPCTNDRNHKTQRLGRQIEKSLLSNFERSHLDFCFRLHSDNFLPKAASLLLLILIFNARSVPDWKFPPKAPLPRRPGLAALSFTVVNGWRLTCSVVVAKTRSGKVSFHLRSYFPTEMSQTILCHFHHLTVSLSLPCSLAGRTSVP